MVNLIENHARCGSGTRRGSGLRVRALGALGAAAALALALAPGAAASAATRPVPRPAAIPAPHALPQFPQHAARPSVASGTDLAPHTIQALVVDVTASRANVHSGPHITDPVTGHVTSGPAFARCQTPGGSVSYGRHYNFWWTRLGDGSWVSNVFVAGGDDDAPLPGVPDC